MKKESCSLRIKQALNIRNIKQVDLSKITRIPKSAISQYISGAFEPKQDRVELIAQALNVNEAWLMGYDVPMERHGTLNSVTSMTTPTVDAIKFALFEGSDDITDEMYEDVLQYAKFIKERKKKKE